MTKELLFRLDDANVAAVRKRLADDMKISPAQRNEPLAELYRELTIQTALHNEQGGSTGSRADLTGEHSITCAKCGSVCSHFERVDVHNRDKEDSPAGLHVQIGLSRTESGVVLDRRMDGNPSDRRDGISIMFSCENCPAINLLEFMQHKGETIMRYRQIGIRTTEARQ